MAGLGPGQQTRDQPEPVRTKMDKIKAKIYLAVIVIRVRVLEWK